MRRFVFFETAGLAAWPARRRPLLRRPGAGRGTRSRGGAALVAHAHVVGPASRDSECSRPSSMAIVRAADGVEQRPVVGHEQQRAVDRRAAHPPAPPGSRGRGGSWARRGSARSRQRRRGSPARAAAARLPRGPPPPSPRPRRRTGTGPAARGPCSGSARSRAEPPRAPCPRRRSPRRAGTGSRARRCGRGAACRRPAGAGRPASRSSVVLPAPFGPTRVTCSPRSSHSSASSSSLRSPADDRRSLELQRDAPAASGLLELEARRPPGASGHAPGGPSSRASSRAPEPGVSVFPRGSAPRIAPCARSRPAGARWPVPAPARAPPSPCATHARGRRRSATARPPARGPRCRPPPGTSGRARRARSPHRCR